MTYTIVNVLQIQPKYPRSLWLDTLSFGYKLSLFIFHYVQSLYWLYARNIDNIQYCDT